MHSVFTTAALLGVAAAAPWGPLGGSGYHGSSTTSASSAAQTPFKFPLADGFPNVNNATLRDIEVAAQGTLPDGALPTHLSPTSITDFQVIALNELFEVAYFSSLLNNITNNVSGYELSNPTERDFVIRTLTAVIAQEELHALGANGILTSAGQAAIQPCEYIFPVSNFNDAITLAFTFTDVVLGTLQDVQNDLATDGDSELITLIGSVIGQEGEQNGYYRFLENKIPSESPFLTRSAGQFAFSALNQNFFVPGSCPFLPNIPVFGALNVDTKGIQPKDQALEFSFKNTHGHSTSGLYLVYIHGQDTPIVENIIDVHVSGETVTFDAFFPFEEFLLDGLTIAAVTTSNVGLTDADAVAKVTLFGPGLIEVN